MTELQFAKLVQQVHLVVLVHLVVPVHLVVLVHLVVPVQAALRRLLAPRHQLVHHPLVAPQHPPAPPHRAPKLLMTRLQARVDTTMHRMSIIIVC